MAYISWTLEEILDDIIGSHQELLQLKETVITTKDSIAIESGFRETILTIITQLTFQYWRSEKDEATKANQPFINIISRQLITDNNPNLTLPIEIP